MEQEQKKNKILDTAMDLFAKNGYSITHITDIASACGMGKSTFYDYFKSKEDLLFEIFNQKIIEPYEDLPAQLEQPGLSPKKKLLLFLQFESAIAQRLGGPKNHRDFFLSKNDILKKEELLTVIQRFSHLRFSIIFRILEEGIASKEFRPVDPFMATAFIISAPLFLYEMNCEPSPIPDPYRCAFDAIRADYDQTKLLDLILNGIRTSE